MDKEIEELLHSLDIDVSRANVAEESSPVFRDVPKVVTKSPCRLFSFGGYLCLGLLSGLISLYSYHYMSQKKPAPPVRMVAAANYAVDSFFASKSGAPSRIVFGSMVPFVKVQDDGLVSYAQEAFYEVPSMEEEAFVKNIRAASSALAQQKRSLASLLTQLRPLPERGTLRFLSQSVDTYIRSHLLAASELEAQLADQVALHTPAGKSPCMYMNLFGGIPQEGCIDVVHSAQKIEKEIEQLFVAFKNAQDIENQSVIAAKLLKMLEKVNADKLLSTLVNVKEYRKKLDRAVQSALESCRSSGGAARTIKEVRSLSLLESCLLKNELMTWKSFEKELHCQMQKFSINSENHLALPTISPAMERIDWSDIIEYTPSSNES